MAGELRSPGGGDNLFIASIVALDAKTGKYKWHYQTIPMESFDFDNTSPLTVADLVVGWPEEARGDAGAEERRLLRDRSGHRQGVCRQTRSCPASTGLTGFDEKNNWAPILNPDANYGKTGKGFYVVPGRAHAWSSQSYNPNTGLIYVPTAYGVGSYVAEKGATILGNQLVDVNFAKQPDASMTRPVLKDARRLPSGLGSGEAQGCLDAAPGQRRRRHADHGRQPGVPGHSRAEAFGYSAPTRAN